MGFTNYPNGITSFGHPVGPNMLGLTGDAFFVVPSSNTATNRFNDWARKRLPRGKVFTTIAGAYAACTSGQNDTVYVFPGTYTVTSALTWAKHNTHLVGLAGPLSRGGLGKSVYVNTTTSAQASVIEVTGDNVQFHNMYLRNAGASATNYCALKLSEGENFFAKNCQFVGQAGATAVDTAACCSLWFYSAAAGKPWGANFEGCRIGSGSETICTAGQVILFSGSPAISNKYITFKDCTIESYSDTAAYCSVHIDANLSIDRYLLFKSCLFYNFSVNHAQALTEVFNDDSGSTHEILLMDCAAMGFSSWDNAGIGYVYAVRGADAAGYGLMEAASSG